MVQIDNLPLILTGLSITASIIYYASVLRNQNKTRQVQLYMELHETRRTPEFQKLWFRVAFIDEWDDVEDYNRKYGPETNLDVYAEHGSIWQQYDGFSQAGLSHDIIKTVCEKASDYSHDLHKKQFPEYERILEFRETADDCCIEGFRITK